MSIKDFFMREPVLLQNITPAPPVFKFTTPEMRPFRPCEVCGKPAIFHRWVENDKALLKFDILAKEDYMRPTNLTFKEDGYAPAGTHVEIVRQTFALVEYDDGTVGKVEPEKVKFTDRRTK